MERKNGGDLVVDCLREQGVRYVFSIIGGQMATICDAIGRNPEMEMITPRSETVSPILACGYTASTGLPSVAMSTVGAGVVYEVAGLYLAWTRYLPVLSIAPQVQSYKMKPHQESLQGCDQDELFVPITKWGAIIHHRDRIPQLLNRAFREALAGVPGPVHLDIPMDVLFKNGLMSRDKLKRLLPPKEKTRYTGTLPGDPALGKKMVRALVRAKKPLVVVGQGMGMAGRYPEIRNLLGQMPFPVVTSLTSAGVVSAFPEVFAGDAGLFTGSPAGKKLLKEADCVLCLGMEPHSRSLWEAVEAGNPNASLVQVETDGQAFLLTRNPQVMFQADPVRALSAVKAGLDSEKGRGPAESREDWRDFLVRAGDGLAQTRAGKLKEFEGVFSMLAKGLGPEDILVADGAQARQGVISYLKNARVRDMFIMDETQMAGAGLPFALGCSLGNPGSHVWLLCDKESLLHNVREIQPARCLGLDFTIVCLDVSGDGSFSADTGRVLQGLGCDVRKMETGKGQVPAFIAGFFRGRD